MCPKIQKNDDFFCKFVFIISSFRGSKVQKVQRFKGSKVQKFKFWGG